ncbi:nucleoside deaminase [Aeromicrobium camelliae]|nr:nucleoside deaminase [Aeromicrobium camelliae]
MTVPDTLTPADREHMEHALRLAWDTLAAGNSPFAAVLVAADGRVLATGQNAFAQSGDPTSHAELDAIRAVADTDRGALLGATMYASGEPCPMCSAALAWARVSRVVYGAAAPDIRAIYPSPVSFTLRCAEVIAAADADIDVTGPVLGEEGLAPFHEAASS